MAKSLEYKMYKRYQKYIKILKKYLKKDRCINGIKKVPVFVFGCQRSGTRVPMEVMDQSEDIIAYREGEVEAFDGKILKDYKILKKLIDESYFSIVAFKPICDSHRARELLTQFPGAKALWIYRNYKDVINSRMRKWKDGTRNLGLIASENKELAGWRMGGLKKEKIDLVKNFYEKNINSADGHALMYYLRSNLFFDLELDKRNDVLLVKYEDAVSFPEIYFENIFQFIGANYKKIYTKTIFKTSIRKHNFPNINNEIEVLCESVQTKLDKHHEKQKITDL